MDARRVFAAAIVAVPVRARAAGPRWRGGEGAPSKVRGGRTARPWALPEAAAKIACASTDYAGRLSCSSRMRSARVRSRKTSWLRLEAAVAVT